MARTELQKNLYVRTVVELSSFLEMEKDDSYTPEEVSNQKSRFDVLFQLIEESDLEFDYYQWKKKNNI